MIEFVLIIFFPFAVSQIQLNLYLTDSINDFQYDCFRLINFVGESKNNQQLMSYCMTTMLLKNRTQNSTIFGKFTFVELSSERISTEQLHLWSAPIDLIEDYQLYLDHLSPLLATKIFYNCTLPRFGLTCEYEFDFYDSNLISLQEMLKNFYRSLDITTARDMSCYIHLECDRGLSSVCLDWSEICDGRIDCQNRGIDEEHCWQLEINECSENEFRCINGQCIPRSFLMDGLDIPDCLDQSDEFANKPYIRNDCFIQQTSFQYEDVTCSNAYLSSSCIEQRLELFMNSLYSIKDPSISDYCWFAYKNLTYMSSLKQILCFNDCQHDSNILMIKEMCPDMIFIPSVPVLYPKIYFAYTKKDFDKRNCTNILFPYTCFNDSRYDTLLINNIKINFNNKICYRFNDQQPLKFSNCVKSNWLEDSIKPALIILKKLNSNSFLCNRSSTYRCLNSSKCISIHRLMDQIDDCPLNDDEDLTQIHNDQIIQMIKRNRIQIQIPTSYSLDSQKKFIEFHVKANSFQWIKETNPETDFIRTHISFQTICDGYDDLAPILIDGRNETDETECSQWSCENIYTLCNGYWNCPYGEDEIHCHSSLFSLNCSSDQRLCVSIYTKQFICLSLIKFNDGIVDCVGANDEPYLCFRNETENHYNNFYCEKHNLTRCYPADKICSGRTECDDVIDEYFCDQNRSIPKYHSICEEQYISQRSQIEHYLCETFSYRFRYKFIHFTLNSSNQIENIKSKFVQSTSSNISYQKQSVYCHRGFAVKIYFNDKNNLTKTVCFCPPSFYGNRCQYQNQRISLTLQFRTSSNSWETPFSIIISLIDNTDRRLIHSYEQFTYLPIRDCQTKFHLYLIYSTRPKNSTKQYSIQIDIYEKISLSYRTSLLLPIQYPFLPVHRLAFIIDIPPSNDTLFNCLNNPCHHGKCLRYFKDRQNSIFCRCDRGWSGHDCSIPNLCTCSSDSLCLGMTYHNRSVCVCPLHKFGPRCLLTNTVCSTNKTSKCFNGGQCIPYDLDIQSDEKYTCICPIGYKGKHCEIVENKLIISFGKDLVSPQSIYIHFIQLIDVHHPYQRMTTFRTILYQQESITIYWSQLFHLVFTEFPKKNYYLTFIRNNNQISSLINTTIHQSNRCPHINEIFNQSFVQMHLIRRIKYYHMPCQMMSYNLSCFYDDIHLCLCQSHYKKRVANCFEFNHNQTFDCQGQSVCENDAHCFQDSQTCPRRSICVCRPCFYGTRCQFSTTAFSLSLDAILNYHIQPHIPLIEQPIIIQISILLSSIFILIGLINSICVMITFQRDNLCKVGSGIYLLSVSITTLLTTIIFGMKFWILIQAQRGAITDRFFLEIQCYIIDFLFTCCLNMDQWLTACIAVERAVIAIKHVRFNREKSRRTAKFVIFILILFIILTNLHDPMFRKLIDEENEFVQRIWCIVSYSSSLKTYNYTMNTFNFATPFLLNLFSVFILLAKKTDQQLNIHTHRSYRSIFIQHIREHKHLLLAPIVCIIFALPRIIISFLFKCMNSPSHSWLYLFGYFISLSPYILTFIVFILPSKFYLSQYRRAIKHFRNRLSRLTHPLFDRIRSLRNNQVHPR